MSSRPDEVVDVTVDDVTYRSDDGRFVVVRVERTHASPEDPHFVAVGDLGNVHAGEPLRLRGAFAMHRSHGSRFEVRSFAPILPTTEMGIVRYLGSGLVKGVGPKLAEKLVARFGVRTLDVIAQESARLAEVSGIGVNRREAMSVALRERRAEAESLSFLHSVGLGPALARRVLRKYGTSAARLLRDDPYRVADELPGVGFTTADAIGRHVGIGTTDPRRIAGLVLHLLGKAADEGHTYLTMELLHEAVPTFGISPDALPDVLRDLERSKLVAFEDDALFAPPILAAELRVASRVAELAHRRAEPKAAAAAVASVAGMLSEEQARAVTHSFSSGLVALTGGPGTGKTTTVRALVLAHEACGREVALCAPTGRAAKRLADASGREAKTIHRLLEWNPGTGSFKKGTSDPIDADVVLVDESSMMDIRIADRLFAAVKPGATLVLVGDANQLPPVGPGQAFREILASEVGAVSRLTQVFRQAQESAIVRGAHAVLHGEAPHGSDAGHVGAGELHYVPLDSPGELPEKLARLLDRIAATYKLSPRDDVQVLSPMRRGPYGTDALNTTLQTILGGGPSPTRLRAGDRVMQLRNDYDRDVYNGDIGEVRRIADGMTEMVFDGRVVTLGADELDDIALAYACTIHKVQGSEFPAVIVVMHGSHHVMLERALLYTAITRGKRLVVLLGDKAAFARASRRASAHRARSRLAARIRSAVRGPT